MEHNEPEPAQADCQELTEHCDDVAMDVPISDNDFDQAYQDELDDVPPPSDDVDESPITKRLANRKTLQYAPQPTPAATIQVQRPVLDNDAFAQFNFIPPQYASRNLKEDKPLGPVQEQGYNYKGRSSGHEPPHSVLTPSVRTSNLSGNLPNAAGMLDVSMQNPRGADATTKTACKQTSPSPVPRTPVMPDELHGHSPQQETAIPAMDRLTTPKTEALKAASESDTEDKPPGQSGDAVMNSNHCRRASSDQNQFQTPGPKTPQPPVQTLVSPETDQAHLTPARRSRPSCVGSSAIHSSRVSKALKKNQARARAPLVERLPTPATTEPQQPSEEDLLYILMSRNRQTRHALERLEHLEEETLTLRHGKATSDAELQQSLQYQEQVESEKDMLCRSLAVFKEKYYKLKKWALEANHDCEALANDASVMKRSLAEVSRDRDDLSRQLRDIQTASGSGCEQMEAIRAKIRDVKESFQDHCTAMSHLSGQYLQQEQRLMDEKHRCGRLESHILHVEQERNKQTLSITSKADMLDTTLQGMSGKLQTLLDDREERISGNVNAFNAFMEMCQMIREKDLATNADLRDVTQSVGTLRVLMQEHLDSVTEIFDVSIADLLDDLQQRSPLAANKVQTEEDFPAVKKVLEDRVDQLRLVINLPDSGTPRVNNGQGKPPFAVKAIREMLEIQKDIYRQQMTTLQNEMNDLSTRCEAAQREITQLSTKNQAADERADELETQHQTAQSKAARLLIMYEEAHAEKEGLQTQLDAAEAKIGELSTNQVNAETEKTKITKERDTARTQLKNLAGINEKAQSDIAALRTKNKTAEIRISELTTKNRTVLKEVDELTANHQAVQREKEELAAERNATQEKFDKLSTKYMKVQTGWTRTAEKCEAVESQLGKVTVDLNVAGGEIQTCKHQLKERREELEVLEKELEDARMNKGLLDDALTKAKDEIHRLKDEEQQHEFEIHELQDDLDGEIQQRREIERKLSHHITFLEELLKEIQVNSQAAVHDKEALQSRIVLLESGVAEGQDTTRTLGETRNALQTTTAELNELRRKQADFEILQQKTVSQQNEIYQKDLEAQSVQQTLSKLQETIANLQEKARSNEHLAREKSVLEKEFSDLQAQNLDQAELETTIQNLRKEAQALNNALATAKTRVTEADALQLKNQELVTSIGSMAADLQQARHECARLPSLNEAIANLDNSISTLQEQLKTAMTEAEEEAQGKDEELQRRNEQITSLEQEKADLQQELLVCEGELANAKLDKEAQPQPQRRVADRSGKRGPVVKGPICSGSTDNVEGVEVFRDEADPELERPTPRSTGNLTVVPETQFDHQASAHVGQNDLLADEGLLNDGSTSELSSVPEDLTHQDDRHNDTQPKRQDQDSQKHDDQMQTKHQVMDQAPSSSYSSHGEQMLLDQLSQNDSGFVPGLSTLPSTITSRQDSGDEDVVGELDRANAMPWNRADWNNAPSRRRLRSESHFRGRQSTPFPGQTADPLHHQDMTPATPRERYLPNSAAKRKLDHDDVSKATQDTPKKMKRNPANLEVKGRREPSGKSQTAGQTSPPVTSGFRKGGSVNGTNATAIAKSQRSSRAGRKSSRQDKYAARFAADT